MFFSKSFGYAIRSVLYLASNESDRRIPLSEVAAKLKVPKHFLAKVMKKLARHEVISSQKGPSGGFICTEKTLNMPLFTIAIITGETALLDSCVLRLRKCNAKNPCPLHEDALGLRNQWVKLLSTTLISDLLKDRDSDFNRRIAID